MNGYLARITPWWRDRILEAGLPDGFTRDLNVLAAIRSHENEVTGLACPSVDRLAVLLGIGKQTVLEGVLSLTERKSMTATKTMLPNRREKYEFRCIEVDVCARNMLFPVHMLVSGIWSYLTPSAKKLWWLCRACAWHGANAVDGFVSAGGAEAEVHDTAFDFLKDGWSFNNFWFVSAHNIDAEIWPQMLGVSRRTMNAAFEELQALHCITHLSNVLEVDPEGPEGFVMVIYPAPPQTRAWEAHEQAFQRRLESIKSARRTTTATKRLLGSLKKKQKQ